MSFSLRGRATIIYCDFLALTVNLLKHNQLHIISISLWWSDIKLVGPPHGYKKRRMAFSKSHLVRSNDVISIKVRLDKVAHIFFKYFPDNIGDTNRP